MRQQHVDRFQTDPFRQQVHSWEIPKNDCLVKSCVKISGWLIKLDNISLVPHCFIFQTQKVTLIPGDGIGPEISNAVKDVFAAAEVCLSFAFSF